MKRRLARGGSIHPAGLWVEKGRQARPGSVAPRWLLLSWSWGYGSQHAAAAPVPVLSPHGGCSPQLSSAGRSQGARTTCGALRGSSAWPEPPLCTANVPSLSPGQPTSHPLELQALAANQSNISSQFSVPETPDLFKLDCLDEFVYVGMLDTQHERLELTIKVWQSPKTTENKEFYHGKHWSLGQAIITSVLLRPWCINTEARGRRRPIFCSRLLPIASADGMGGDKEQRARVPTTHTLGSRPQSRHCPPTSQTPTSPTTTSMEFPGKIHFQEGNVAWKIPAPVGNDKQGAVMETLLQP